ncbi:6-bladed beta-propeller [Gemmatimonadota bacterium]
MINHSLRCCGVILFLLSGGCSNSDTEAGHHFAVQVVDGVETAINSGDPRYSEELFRYELLCELEQDVDGESFLISPTSILMSSQGNFFVCDVGDSRIKVFDSSGSFQGSIGREGSGPGEFLRAFSITQINSDRITVFERSQRRITHFSSDGQLEDVIPVPGISLFENEVYQLGEDRFLGMGVEQGNPGIMPGTLRSFAFYHTALGDTISHYSGDWIQVSYKIPGTEYWFRGPLGPNPTWVCRPDWGWIITAGTDPVLNLYGMDGELQLRIETGIEPIPITSDDYSIHRRYMDEELAALPVRAEEMGMSESRIQASLDRTRAYRNADLGDMRAYWKSIEIDDRHFIWLEVAEHYAERADGGAGRKFRVFSPNGEYLGITRRPTETPGSGISNGHFITIEVHQDSGMYIVKAYQMTSAIGEFAYSK